MDQQYQHYERLVFVAHSQADLETYRPQAQEVARFCERWGCATRRCSAPTSMCGDWSSWQNNFQQRSRRLMVDGDFLVIPPGGEIRQEYSCADLAVKSGHIGGLASPIYRFPTYQPAIHK